MRAHCVTPDSRENARRTWIFSTTRTASCTAKTSPPAKIAAEVGTPVYVYSKATFLHHYRQIADAFAPLNPTICYSIKSCGNINICKVLAAEGCGFDVTSGGELFRALQAGGDPKKIIYAGVGKTDQEIADGINAGIAAFNIESEAEIENIDRVAGEMGKTGDRRDPHQPRRRPGAKTHAKTTTGKKETKFGVDIERAERVFEQYRNLKNLRIGGVHIHIGSPVYDIQPYVDAVTKMTALIDRLTERGHKIEWFDVGGGFGVNYEQPDQAMPVTEHAKALVPLLQGKPYTIAFEPGRYIAGNAGILLTRVLYRKQGGEKKFVIVDAGHERPDPPDAVRELPPHLAGEAASRRTCPPSATRSAGLRRRRDGRRRRPDLRERRLPRPRTGHCRRSSAATCSPSSPPARTASR